MQKNKEVEKKPKVRFIAAALCPSCNAQDVLKASYGPEGRILSVSCVACGYEEELKETGPETPASPGSGAGESGGEKVFSNEMTFYPRKSAKPQNS